MARPRKQEHEKRSARLGPYDVTEAERADVEDKAAAAGLSLAEFGRQQILTGRVNTPPAPIEAGLITELNRLALENKRIGVNLNQLMPRHHLGVERDPRHIDFILAELHTNNQKIEALLDKVARRYGS